MGFIIMVNFGGYFGVEFKFVGWDVIVVEG